MAEPCIIKKDSSPPLCGVHHVHLLAKQLPDEMIASGYKGFTFFVCPVTGTVLNDEATRRKGPR